MRLEGLTVCIDFHDFLVDTLSANRSQFDKYTIVTSSKDTVTQEIALNHRCKLILVDNYYLANGFCKSRLLNAGLATCPKFGWICVVDADIILPNNLRQQILTTMRTNRRQSYNTLFGIHRLMCYSRKEYLNYLQTKTHNWPVEKVRPVGRCPAGYFHLWHNAINKSYRYDETYPRAKDSNHGGYHGDLAFGRQFPRRAHFDDLYAIHLATKHSPAEDYDGRRSNQWQ
jgi:hypothetical protein